MSEARGPGRSSRDSARPLASRVGLARENVRGGSWGEGRMGASEGQGWVREMGGEGEMGRKRGEGLRE